LSSPEALLARILEQVPQPVWVVDHRGLIMFANPAACSALGYRDPGELLGKPSHEAVHYKREDGHPLPGGAVPDVAAPADHRRR
jgi:PAS domain S-box-containing protein